MIGNLSLIPESRVNTDCIHTTAGRVRRPQGFHHAICLYPGLLMLCVTLGYDKVIILLTVITYYYYVCHLAEGLIDSLAVLPVGLMLMFTKRTPCGPYQVASSTYLLDPPGLGLVVVQ